MKWGHSTANWPTRHVPSRGQAKVPGRENRLLPVGSLRVSSGGNRKKEAETLLRMGDGYRDIGEPDVNDPFRKPGETDLTSAMEVYEQARTLSHATQDTPVEARALVLLGEAGLARTQQQKTLSCWQQAIHLYRANGDKQALADLLSRAAELYYETGEKQKALENFAEERPLREELRDQKGAGKALAGIGRVHLGIGDGRKALEFFQRAWPDLESAKDSAEQAAVQRYIGLTYWRCGSRNRKPNRVRPVP